MRKYINTNKILIFILCILFLLLLWSGEKKKIVNIEDLDIYVGVGYGLNKEVDGNITYRVSTIANMYKEDETIETSVNTGVDFPVGKIREERQKKTGKKFFLGLLKTYILDEEFARYGVKSFMDIIFKNPTTNDNGVVLVCKGKNESFFKYNAPGYGSTSEYISDMVKNLSNYNFFSKDYTFRKIMFEMGTEGKNAVCPYIELKEDGIKITGVALFKGEKLSTVLDINETRIMNLLREDNVNGILNLQKDLKEYASYKAKSKRKVKCEKIEGKYNFVIDLDLEGEVINNELYKKTTEKIDVTKKIEEDMKKEVEEKCNTFLNKMKNQYKVDCLQLGFVAAGKYGKGTEVDWNEVVSNSEIKVNVKVHVEKLGRGQY